MSDSRTPLEAARAALALADADALEVYERELAKREAITDAQGLAWLRSRAQTLCAGARRAVEAKGLGYTRAEMCGMRKYVSLALKLNDAAEALATALGSREVGAACGKDSSEIGALEMRIMSLKERTCRACHETDHRSALPRPGRLCVGCTQRLGEDARWVG